MIDIKRLLSFYVEAQQDGESVTLQPLRQLQQHADREFSATDGNEYVIVHDVRDNTYVALVMSVECGLGGVGGHSDYALESGRGDVLLAKRFETRVGAFAAVLEIIAVDNDEL